MIGQTVIFQGRPLKPTLTNDNRPKIAASNELPSAASHLEKEGFRSLPTAAKFKGDRQDRRADDDADAPGRRLRMIRRRAAEAGFKQKLGCHVFRATGITAYLEAGGTLENAQAMAAHESPRTTKLYDRTSDAITLDEVERITI